MNTISYSTFRAQLAGSLDKVNQDDFHKPGPFNAVGGKKLRLCAKQIVKGLGNRQTTQKRKVQKLLEGGTGFHGLLGGDSIQSRRFLQVE